MEGFFSFHWHPVFPATYNEASAPLPTENTFPSMLQEGPLCMRFATFPVVLPVHLEKFTARGHIHLFTGMVISQVVVVHPPRRPAGVAYSQQRGCIVFISPGLSLVGNRFRFSSTVRTKCFSCLLVYLSICSSQHFSSSGRRISSFNTHPGQIFRHTIQPILFSRDYLYSMPYNQHL